MPQAESAPLGPGQKDHLEERTTVGATTTSRDSTVQALRYTKPRSRLIRTGVNTGLGVHVEGTYRELGPGKCLLVYPDLSISRDGQEGTC